MIRTTYVVAGMTCDDCVRAVTVEVTNLPGVTEVDVDLATGEMTLVSIAPVDGASLRAVVAEAGYELVG